MLLENKVAIISGMGPGLGQELARGFVRDGARIGVCCRSEDYLSELAEELRGDGAEVVAVAADVTDRAACARLVEATVEAFGRVDCVVNSAYTPGPFALFEDAEVESWRTPFEVNVIGALQLIQTALPHLKAAGGGAIVNVNSMVHKLPLPMQGAYMTSKAALAGATKALAKELGAYRIRVNSVFMGWMWGPPVEAFIEHSAKQRGISTEAMRAEIVEAIPLGFIPEDADCANAVAFLCSDRARVITGASLDVNGGEFMP